MLPIQWTAYDYPTQSMETSMFLRLSINILFLLSRPPPPPGSERLGPPTTSHELHNYVVFHTSSPHLTQSLVSYPFLQLIQHVFHNHSSRPRPRGSIPHPYSIAHDLLFHCRGHSDFPRLHNTPCSYNNCYIHSSRIYNDPPARS